MNERILKIILACLLSLIIIALTIFLIFALNNENINFATWGFNSKTELIKTENHNYGDIYYVKVNTKSADIKIVPTDKNEITVNVYGEKNQNVNVEVTNGILNVEYFSKFLCFGFCNMDSYVEIMLPNEFSPENLDINTVSGDIFVGDTATQNMDVKSVSGDISVGNSDILNVSTTSGDIKVTKAKDLKVKSVSGDLRIDSVTNSLVAQTTSGDVDINSLMINADSNIKSTSGDIEIDMINDIYVETSTVSGDVRIKNNNRLANIVLSIYTTSGDIKIN